MSSARERIARILECVAEQGTPPSWGVDDLDVGTSDYLSFFEKEILKQRVLVGGSACRFIAGPHGSGKSHVLRLIEQRALNLGFAVYLAELGPDLRLEDWKAVAKDVLENIYWRGPEGLARSAPEIATSLLRRERGDLDQSLTRVSHSGLRRTVAGLREEANSAEAIELCKRFILGERVGARELRAVGVSGVRDPLSARNAELFLTSALNALVALGVPGVLLAFDENERTLDGVPGGMPTRRVQRAANLVRRLVDTTIAGRMASVVTVFTVLPEFFERAKRAYSALGERIEPILIERDESAIPWRTQSLHIRSVTTLRSPEAFAAAAIEQVLTLRDEFTTKDRERVMRSMEEVARNVIGQHADDSYRRHLMKGLATLAMEPL